MWPPLHAPSHTPCVAESANAPPCSLKDATISRVSAISMVHRRQEIPSPEPPPLTSAVMYTSAPGATFGAGAEGVAEYAMTVSPCPQLAVNVTAPLDSMLSITQRSISNEKLPSTSS
jgi:hypothetical protein